MKNKATQVRDQLVENTKSQTAKQELNLEDEGI